jgi:hypothetical protein
LTTRSVEELRRSFCRREALPLPSGQAVPVKDEEERLPACLRALARQFDRSGRPIPPELLRVAIFDRREHWGLSRGSI